MIIPSNSERNVIEPFLDDYVSGLTPSPCPVCNRRVKFSFLLEEAQTLNCDRLATGHYARIKDARGELGIFTGVDKKKDQSYFLFNLKRDFLERLLFPMGDFRKDEIRDFLRAKGLAVHSSEESQELCFIRNESYTEFLVRNGIRDLPGEIVNCEGKILGRHQGICRFTVGQRRGMGVCGPNPLYVLKILPESGAIVVGSREQSFRQTFWVGKVNWLASQPPKVGDSFLVKIRSTTSAVPCLIQESDGESLKIRFVEPQQSVAPGQAAVLYSDDRLMGGGWILARTNDD